jgi:uncharacterized protein YjeT (DUF2065 family)
MLGESRQNGKKIFGRLERGRGRKMSLGYFLTVIGLICFLEGLPYLAFPKQIKIWLAKLMLLPIDQLRMIGGALMAVGLLLVYWGRRYGG